MAVQDLERIEQKIDRAVAGSIAVSDNMGGILFTDMAQLLEMAKLMSVSQTAVPKHLRGNPGACLSICIQALEWRFSPFSVANQSYEVNDRIAYQSMLIHAVIEARAPLKERLRPTYEGEGPKLRCIITGHLKNELEPRDYRSPEIGTIKVKNSPLWVSDPEQQLFYYASRAWARRHCPDVLLGVFSKDELEDSEIGPDNARNITPEKPNIGERLKSGGGKRGFAKDNVDRALEHKPGETVPAATAQADPVEVKAELEKSAEGQRQAEPTVPAVAAVPSQELTADAIAGLRKDLDLAAKGGMRELGRILKRLSPNETAAAAPWADDLNRQAAESDKAVGAGL